MRSSRSDAPKPNAHARADISHVPGLHDWERVVLVDNGVSAIAGVRLDLYDAEDEPGEPKKDEEGMIAL